MTYPIKRKSTVNIKNVDWMIYILINVSPPWGEIITTKCDILNIADRITFETSTGRFSLYPIDHSMPILSIEYAYIWNQAILTVLSKSSGRGVFCTFSAK